MASSPVLPHGPADAPLSERVWQLPPDTTLLVAPGTYRGPISLPHTIELRAAAGLGSVTLETAEGGTLSVEGAERVRLVDLVLHGPKRGMGAILRIYNPADVELERCLLTGGRGQGEGGGAVDIQQGRLRMNRCRLTRNVAMQGGGVRAGGAVLVEIRNSIFADNTATGVGGGGLFCTVGGEVHLVGCTFVGNEARVGRAILAGGDALGHGVVKADNCLFAAGGAELSATAITPGRLHLTHCVLPALPDSVHQGVSVGASVIERRLEVQASGEDAWAATFPAALLDLGDVSLYADGEADLRGKPRERIWIGAVG